MLALASASSVFSAAGLQVQVVQKRCQCICVLVGAQRVKPSDYVPRIPAVLALASAPSVFSAARLEVEGDLAVVARIAARLAISSMDFVDTKPSFTAVAEEYGVGRDIAHGGKQRECENMIDAR